MCIRDSHCRSPEPEVSAGRDFGTFGPWAHGAGPSASGRRRPRGRAEWLRTVPRRKPADRGPRQRPKAPRLGSPPSPTSPSPMSLCSARRVWPPSPTLSLATATVSSVRPCAARLSSWRSWSPRTSCRGAGTSTPTRAGTGCAAAPTGPSSLTPWDRSRGSSSCCRRPRCCGGRGVARAGSASIPPRTRCRATRYSACAAVIWRRSPCRTGCSPPVRIPTPATAGGAPGRSSWPPTAPPRPAPASAAPWAADRLRPATPHDLDAARAVVGEAAQRMGRRLDPDALPELLAAHREDPHWNEVAQRCLSCGNCTLVCPTCFCTTVVDATDVTGTVAERRRHWVSCFDLDFSYLHAGSVRASTSARYRHWISHKLGTWPEQFGTAGCVGCGRCITWCPVGIDITAEIAALRGGVPEGGGL